jgi:hypothetical protein
MQETVVQVDLLLAQKQGQQAHQTSSRDWRILYAGCAIQFAWFVHSSLLSLGPFFANTLQEAVLYIRLANVAGILAVYSVAAAAWVLAAHTKALTARLGAGSAMGIRAAERSAGLKIFSIALCVVSPGMLCGLLSPWVMNRTGIMVHSLYRYGAP